MWVKNVYSVLYEKVSSGSIENAVKVETKSKEEQDRQGKMHEESFRKVNS